MKATGIVRRIDELGRVVIPKEIRRTFRIKDGTPLEIFCGDGGELVLKKYSMLEDLKNYADEICKAIHSTLNVPTLICDNEKVLSCYGNSKSNLQNKEISKDVEKIIEQRKEMIKNKSNGDILVKVLNDDDDYEYYAQMFVPILSGGDVFGCIICYTKEQTKFVENQCLVLKAMVNLLSEQIA
ncbi:MAG: AbrB/MazE/SpoVT family DNA-binding domain-containing protein [Clostridiales bacterium]|nr:AbrB/MazE/SpoVT family DNA-binding domain-containing protein [Candidatus Apopatousia equi]